MVCDGIAQVWLDISYINPNPWYVFMVVYDAMNETGRMISFASDPTSTLRLLILPSKSPRGRR